MYRMEFEGNALYLFEVNSLGKYINYSNPLVWQDITGMANAVNIKLDPSEGAEAFCAYIKQSLELTLIRTDETIFNDIISGNDEEWFAVVVRGG